jgi:hypothetical protein
VKTILLIAGLLTIQKMSAQDSWKIKMNGKTLISTSVSDETMNVKTVKSSEWKKNGYLEISYSVAGTAGLQYTIRVNDENGVELVTREKKTSTRIALADLRKRFKGRKQLKIYIVIAPPDPMMAMPVRMVHLGTLKLP